MVNFYPLNKASTVRFNEGFSFVELLTTLIIASIVVVYVIPGLQTFVLNTRRDALLDGIFNALNYTRLSALSQNGNVMICPFSSVNSTACGGNWQAGWIIVTQPATGSPVILQSHNLTAPGTSLSSSAESIIFNAQGIASNQANFTVCDSRGSNYARSLTVLPSGFVQIGSTAGQAVWDNSQLVCP